MTCPNCRIESRPDSQTGYGCSVCRCSPVIVQCAQCASAEETAKERDAIARQVETMRAALEQSLGLVLGWEAWEASLIMDSGCWEPDGMADYPRITQPHYDALVPLMQRNRNAVKESLRSALAGPPVPCDRCDGDGKAHGSDRPFDWKGPGTYPGPCPKCKGHGVVAGSPVATPPKVADADRTAKLRDLVIASVRLAIVRHDLVNDESETDVDAEADAICRDTWDALNGVGTCSGDVADELAVLLESGAGSPVAGEKP